MTSSPKEQQEFLLEIVASRRILQENETLPVTINGSIGQKEIGANAQGIRNCGSDLKIPWDNDENAHPFYEHVDRAASFSVVENAPINVLKAGYDGFFEGLFVHWHLYEDFW